MGVIIPFFFAPVWIDAQNLDRDGFKRPQVVGLPDLAEAAFPEKEHK